MERGLAMRVALLFPLLLAVLGSAPVVAQDAGEPNPFGPGSRWLISCGVTTYADEAIPGRTDGEAYSYTVGMLMADPNLGAVPAEHLGVYAAGLAKLETLRGALVFAATAKEEDVVLVYLCLTTAVVKAADGTVTTYLLPCDAKPSDIAHTGLSFDELGKLLGAVPAKRKIVFLDCSPWAPYRPEGTPKDAAAPDGILDSLAKSCVVVSAVSPKEGYAEGGLKRPLLGFCLSNAPGGFRGGSDDGAIDMAELMPFISATADNVYEGTNPRQTPKALGRKIDRTVFCRSTSSDPAPARCQVGMRLVEDRVCVDIYEFPNIVGAMPLTGTGYFGFQGQCKNKGKRMCEPDEWTAACRGPDGYRFGYGNDPVPGRCNVGLGLEGPERIGSRPFCVNGYGLYDMIGNVSEYLGSGWGGEHPTVDTMGSAYRDTSIYIDCTAGGPKNPIISSPHIGTRCCADPAKKR